MLSALFLEKRVEVNQHVSLLACSLPQLALPASARPFQPQILADHVASPALVVSTRDLVVALVLEGLLKSEVRLATPALGPSAAVVVAA